MMLFRYSIPKELDELIKNNLHKEEHEGSFQALSRLKDYVYELRSKDLLTCSL